VVLIAYGQELLPPPATPSTPYSRLSVIFNGLPLTGKDDRGVRWQVRKPLRGWWGPTGSNGEAVQRSYQDGAWLGKAYAPPRTLVVEGLLTVSAGDGPEGHRHLLDSLDTLYGALPMDDVAPFVVTENGYTRHVLARLDGTPADPEWFNPWRVRYDFQLITEDHRKFSGDGTTPTHMMETGLPTQTGGLAFPASFPTRFDADIVTGIIPITNEGNARPPVTVTIHGPGAGPIIRSGDGQSMPFDITLDVGQFLVVDLDRKTVKLNGQASRRGALRGRWINLAPGSNTLMFDAASYNPGTRFSVAWYDAWK
jgi:hypothetical protein